MKKFLFTLVASSLLSSPLFSQDSEFDKKFRFGLRVNPQPTWYVSNEKSNVPSGATFGFGFGLNMERRFSDVAAILTGIGGDFEGGKYTFRNDPSVNYEPVYWMDENNELIKATAENRTNPKNTGYVLKERTLKSTYVTIPIILKLSTKEYGGLKYSGMFGGELGVRVKSVANDTYSQLRKYNDSGYVVVLGEESLNGINVNKEGSVIPMRLTLNAGLGVEYRLAGTTSAFVNINYVRGLTSQLRKESEYVIYKTEPGASNSTPIKQNLKMSGIRISIGIMF